MADPDLDQHIQALPQELQDIIFDLTISPDSNRVVTITPEYRAPTQLQISRASRNIAAERYYTNAPFAFSELEDTGCNSLDFVKKWLESLTPEHVSLLTELRFLTPNDRHLISFRPKDLRFFASKKERLRTLFRPGHFFKWIQLHSLRIWLDREGIEINVEALRTQHDKAGEARMWLSCEDLEVSWKP